MQDIFIEYMIKREKTYRTTLRRIAIIACLLVVLALVVLFTGSLGGLSFVGPLVAVIAIYCAHYLYTSLNVEYEYSVTNGELDVDQIIAQRRRKRLITLKCKELEDFGRYHPEEHQKKSYQTRIFACDNPQNPDLWFCTARTGERGLTLVVINMSEKMLAGIKPYLPRPILHNAFRK